MYQAAPLLVSSQKTRALIATIFELSVGFVVAIAISFLLRGQLEYLYRGTTWLELTKDGAAFAKQYVTTAAIIRRPPA